MTILIALLAVAGVLGLVVRQLADLKAQVDHVTSEISLEASATRLYLGRLSGRDPGLHEPTIDCGKFRTE